MSFKGIICPYKFENEGKTSCKDCLACADSLKNPCGQAYETIKFVFDHQEDRGTMLSPSAITGCMRKTYLCRTNDYYESLDRLWPAARGTLFHYALENAKRKGAIVEKRFHRTLSNGLVIYAKPDSIYPKEGLIKDWKSCAHVPQERGPFVNGFPNHVEQINEYIFVLAKPDDADPIYITSAEIHYFDMYRPKPVKPPIWEFQETQDILETNASILQKAFDIGEVPPVLKNYPREKFCEFCPPEIQKICADIWRMGQTQ